MTRGPEPHEAIRKAMKNAAARGKVIDRELLREARLQFILFCAGLTIFVLVRRTRSHLMTPEDCAAEYRLDLLRLRRIPLNGANAHEAGFSRRGGPGSTSGSSTGPGSSKIRADGTPVYRE